MLQLRADPWDPEFGMGFEAGEDPAPAGVETGVETDDWTQPLGPGQLALDATVVRFVDGVRRIDLRLIATDGGVRAPGLFGSFAVGTVERQDAARFAQHEVGRLVVLGGGLQASEVGLDISGMRLAYEPLSIATSEPDQPLRALQQRMREAEAVMAAQAAADDGVIVFVDGPLGFTSPTAGVVVGVVKRSVRTYLEPAQDALIGRLAPGQRTPLFALGTGEGSERFSWYARLVEQRPLWHDHAGVVRCEVRGSLAVSEAVALADRVSGMLPAFAGRPSDPRAPQNLAPVGALETWLKRHLGSAGLIRRALSESLMEGAA